MMTRKTKKTKKMKGKTLLMLLVSRVSAAPPTCPSDLPLLSSFQATKA